MKYSLMSLMVDEQLHHEKVNFILGSILAAVGIQDIPDTADEAYAMLNQRGIPMQNGTASFEDLVRFTAENGFDGLNMMSFQMELTGAEHRAILEKYGVVLSDANVIVPFSDAATEEEFQAVLEQSKALIDQAVQAGAKHILLVPGGYRRRPDMTREQIFRAMTRGINACLEYAKDTGVPISTETLETTCVPWCSIADMERIFSVCPDLAYNHDSGNPLVANEDPMEMLNRFGERVVNVHFKDLAPTEDPSGQKTYRCMDGTYVTLAPLGEGLVDFPAHLRKLQELGYQGYITLEGGRPAESKWEEARQALAYFRDLEQNL